MKHSEGRKRLASAKKRDEDIINALGKYDEKFHPKVESLPNSTRLYRNKVVITMLKAGVPLNKVDVFRDLLEESSYALTSATNLRQLLPFIRHKELDTLKREISNKPPLMGPHTCARPLSSLCGVFLMRGKFSSVYVG